MNIIPGTDTIRSATLSSIALAYLIYFANSDLPNNARVTTIIAIAVSACLAVWAIVHGLLLQNADLSDLVGFRYLFMPKLSSTLAGLLFLSTICFWVYSLRGVRYSPFAPILTFAPLYYVLQLSREDERQQFQILVKNWSDSQNIDIPDIAFMWKIVRSMEVSGLIFIILTTAVAEFALPSLWDKVLLQRVEESTSYVVISYVSYYVASLCAAYAALPPQWRQSLFRQVSGLNTITP